MSEISFRRVATTIACVAIAAVAACADGRQSSNDDGSSTNGGAPDGGASDGAASADVAFFGDAHEAGGVAGDPTTCADAAKLRTYAGCDYWPVPLTNSVWSIFDFAVVVANGQTQPAIVTVGGQTVTVQPNALATIYLPWVPALKLADGDECGSAPYSATTMIVKKAAYHLVSSVPVTVYQFNALEYKGEGGPPGKDWSSCPGNKPCSSNNGQPIGCYSFTNDASLLLPSTAMTANYRFTSAAASAIPNTPIFTGGYGAIIATDDGTHVSLTLGASGYSWEGAGMPAGKPGDVLHFTLDAGDVAEIAVSPPDFRNGQPGGDLGGSLVQADKPIEVIAGGPCMDYPSPETPACDHVEQSVLPAETLGKHYVVTVPTSPGGTVVGHLVRFYGNRDGTYLTYAPSKPAGCPDTLAAGQVAACQGIIKDSFEVTADAEFGVLSMMLGASIADPQGKPPNQKGDPSLSVMIAIEQWRDKYVFLAPADYDESWADIAAPSGASIVIDGAPLAGSPQAISASYGVWRVKLGPGNGGQHKLESDRPVGLQVIGYGAYTSYQYPGGMNLKVIAPSPPPPK
jgi:hypothetical protein